MAFDPITESIFYQTIYGSFQPDSAVHTLFGLNQNRVAINICNPGPDVLYLTWSPTVAGGLPQVILPQNHSHIYTWDDYGVVVTFPWYAQIQASPVVTAVGDPAPVIWTEIIYRVRY